MKKFFFFASAMVAALTMNAQTITIDGANSDWADVPMVTEPGTMPIAKFLVPQQGVTMPENAAYSMMVVSEESVMMENYPVIYTDADKNASTGSSIWICPAMGVDYEMATWSDGSAYAKSATGDIVEMCIKQSAFSGTPFTGSCWTWLTYNWGARYFPTDPETQGYKWDESTYHAWDVKPFAYADLNGTHAAADIYSSHEAMILTNGLSMVNSDNEDGRDLALWASWAVELVTPGVYDVTAAGTFANTTSPDLTLVNVATNQIVATFTGADQWQPEPTFVFGSWDLSAVSAGKYMLVLRNHTVNSSAVFSSITLTKQGTTGFDRVAAEAAPAKMIRNGHFMINHNGKYIHALGF